MSNSLQPYGLQHARPESITNSQSLLKLMSIELVMPSNHLILRHPLLLLSSIFPASGSFLMSQFFASSGQSLGVSASTSVLPMTIQDRFPLRWTGWISLQSKGLSRVFSNTTVQNHQFFFFIVQLSHPYMTTEKAISLTRWTFVGKLISLLFNTLSRLVIAFLPRSKCLLISWLQSPSAVILNPKKIKSVTIFIVESLAIFKYKWWINNLNMWKDQHSSNTITLQIMLIYLEFFFFFYFRIWKQKLMSSF